MFKIVAGRRVPGISIGTYGTRRHSLPRFKVRFTVEHGLLVAVGPVYMGVVR